MADYKTPGRQLTNVSASAGSAGSAGRRVVRSALELLVDTASPELLKRRGISSSPKEARHAPVKFTVTHTAAPPGSVGTIKVPPSLATTNTFDAGHHQYPRLPEEEPSTLLFLSPSSARGGGDSVVKKRLFIKRKVAKHSDSAKKKRKVMAERGDRSCEKMVEIGSSPLGTVFPSAECKGERPYDENRFVLSRSEPLFTEEEVQQRILEALKAYEASRDAEEESVLQEVGHEIESQNERYEKLLQEKSVLIKERDSFHAKMEQLAVECEALQSTIAGLHQELQEEREKMSRVEVELCHAKDETRLASSGMQQELNFEKAQWKLAQEEMRHQISEIEAQLSCRTAECRELQKSLASKESERVQLFEQLESVNKENQEWRNKQNELESTKTELQELVRAKEAFIRQMQHRLQESERAVKHVTTTTRDEHVQLEARLQSVEVALQQQTDEVRRKMHRIHMLEADHTKAERVIKALRQVIRKASTNFLALRAALESCVEAYRSAVPRAAARHGQQLRRGLRSALFPVDCCNGVEDDSVSGTGDNGEIEIELGQSTDERGEDNNVDEEDSGNASLLGLISDKQLRTELRRSCFLSRKAGVVQRERRQRVQVQVRGSGSQGPAKKGAGSNGVEMEGDEADECDRLHRCQRQCERFLETLQRLLVRHQEEGRRHAARLETHHAERSEEEVARCRDALAACQAGLEQSKQQGKLMEEECHRRSSEIQKLEGKLEELRLSEQELKMRQRDLTRNAEDLQRERDVLHLQLKVSQQDCVDIRERYESIRLEAGEVQERLRLLEETHRTQETANEAKSKALAKLARCTERLKKSEGECELLRSENNALSTKVKSMLLQLQASRIQQRGKNATSPACHKQSEELTALTKELSALRGLQESANAHHTKERKESELSMGKLRAHNSELRAELVEAQRALADVRNEVVLQQRAEMVTLHTLLSIHQGGLESPIVSCAEGQSDGVQQKLFDCSPTPRNVRNGGTIASHMEMTTAEMRGRVVSLAQRAVLELARLREVCAVAPRTECVTAAAAAPTESNTLDSFLVAEQLALDSAQRSTRRRQVCGDDWGGTAPPPLPPRVEPTLHAAEHQHHHHHHQSCLLGTPQQHASAVIHRSPSPMQVDGEAMSSAHHSRHPASFTAANSSKSTSRIGMSFPRHGMSLASLTSTAGVSRSRSGHGAVDGSGSPARPPVLRGSSVH